MPEPKQTLKRIDLINEQHLGQIVSCALEDNKIVPHVENAYRLYEPYGAEYIASDEFIYSILEDEV